MSLISKLLPGRKDKNPLFDRKKSDYSVIRGESDIVQEKEISNNATIQLYQGYLKDLFYGAKVFRLSSIPLDSESGSDKELELMISLITSDMNKTYSKLDEMLLSINDEKELPEGKKLNEWRANRIKILKEEIDSSDKTSIFHRLESRLAPKSVEENKDNGKNYRELEKQVIEHYSNIKILENQLYNLEIIKFQDTITDIEKRGISELYQDILDHISVEKSIDDVSRKNLEVHFAREKQKSELAKNQNLKGYKREIYRIDNVQTKKSQYVSRIIPAGHDMTSEMSYVKGGYRLKKVEKFKDKMIWIVLIISQIITTLMALSETFMQQLSKRTTWGYASGWFAAFIFGWYVIGKWASEVKAHEAVYNIARISYNETITYFDSNKILQTHVADVYELELINSTKNNLDVTLGRSANDVANLTNAVVVGTSRQLTKKNAMFHTEINIANEEKQSLLERIEQFKPQAELSYYQGLVDGASLKGQVLVQMAENRLNHTDVPRMSSESIEKIVKITVVLIFGVIVLLFMRNTDVVLDLSSPIFGYAFLAVIGLIFLTALAFIFNTAQGGSRR